MGQSLPDREQGNTNLNELNLVAKTSFGFMGLNEAHDYFVVRVDNVVRTQRDFELILDFSSVKFWDVSAMLWIVIALDYYRKLCHSLENGIRLILRLPEGENQGRNFGPEFAQSGDFLRRWGFGSALRNLVPDPDLIMVPSQQGYFLKKPVFYTPATVEDNGVLQALISLQLAEIRNLCDVNGVSSELIHQVKREFTAARFGDVLYNECGFAKSVGAQFSDQILNEAIRNVSEHPNATIGMVAIGTLRQAKRLILAVVDNGESIPRTIFPHYLATREGNTLREQELLQAAPLEYEKLGPNGIADVIAHATDPGVSRKLQPGGQLPLPLEDGAFRVGYGLTYIKNDTIDRSRGFAGDLWIVSGGISVRFRQSEDDANRGEKRNHKDFGFRWPGNLIRVSIPLSPAQGGASES